MKIFPNEPLRLEFDHWSSVELVLQRTGWYNLYFARPEIRVQILVTKNSKNKRNQISRLRLTFDFKENLKVECRCIGTLKAPSNLRHFVTDPLQMFLLRSTFLAWYLDAFLDRFQGKI